ncbi:hypothetical protein BDZ91DRAFT_758895 [Kalaharituber pfeilii]|nr:hypothetical protein BDZ91DRAFT_758895 [Kalaharituber pfeilii]
MGEPRAALLLLVLLLCGPRQAGGYAAAAAAAAQQQQRWERWSDTLCAALAGSSGACALGPSACMPAWLPARAGEGAARGVAGQGRAGQGRAGRQAGSRQAGRQGAAVTDCTRRPSGLYHAQPCPAQPQPSLAPAQRPHCAGYLPGRPLAQEPLSRHRLSDSSTF